MGLAIGAAGAKRWCDRGKLMRNEMGLGEEAKAVEAEVAEPFVVGEQEVLFSLDGGEGRVQGKERSDGSRSIGE